MTARLLIALFALTLQLTSAARVRADTIPRFRRGDVNVDARVDFGDALFFMSRMVAHESAMPCGAAADIDDDGRIGFSDTVLLIEWLVGSGLPPAMPGPFDCGVDPTPDVECRDYSPCAPAPSPVAPPTLNVFDEVKVTLISDKACPKLCVAYQDPADESYTLHLQLPDDPEIADGPHVRETMNRTLVAAVHTAPAFLGDAQLDRFAGEVMNAVEFSGLLDYNIWKLLLELEDGGYTLSGETEELHALFLGLVQSQSVDDLDAVLAAAEGILERGDPTRDEARASHVARAFAELVAETAREWRQSGSVFTSEDEKGKTIGSIVGAVVGGIAGSSGGLAGILAGIGAGWELGGEIGDALGDLLSKESDGGDDGSGTSDTTDSGSSSGGSDSGGDSGTDDGSGSDGGTDDGSSSGGSEG